MIVVFVIDTSPSMGETVPNISGISDYGKVSKATSMSRLDLAKMTVESLTKVLERRVNEHNHKVQMEALASTGGNLNANNNAASKSLHNIGFGFSQPDQFLLLSTGRQYASHPASVACGAGGRLLVGFHHLDTPGSTGNSNEHHHPYQKNFPHESFERELKRLKPTMWKQHEGKPMVPFPDGGGGAVGLNAALSTGLQLLSRHRLKYRCTENFGMGRLPSTAILIPSGNSGSVGFSQAANALQPACLILLTDGDCLTKNQAEGGGNLQLQFGNLPLRDFYQEPFRWDQRIFCIGVGSSSNKLHNSLKAFCEVTGGCHLPLSSVAEIQLVSDILLRRIAPHAPNQMCVPNPLRMPSLPPVSASLSESSTIFNCMTDAAYVNGGPICSFQQLEAAVTHRAMLLYTPYHMDMLKLSPNIHSAPIWCIPESFFPSKKLENLPPRTAQPVLHYARHHSVVGSVTFDPLVILKSLHRLDQLTISTRLLFNTYVTNVKETPVKVLQRDVYICKWLCQDWKRIQKPHSQLGQEHFAVCVRGAGRSSLSDGDESFLNIGILHIPSGGTRISTLTLLPPDPHILFPLLIKAIESEHRALKKVAEKKEVTNALLLSASRNVHMDENWRSLMKAYLFRLPPYFFHSIRRSLRTILPSSVHSLLSADSIDSIVSQCFSRVCLQKIRSGEQFAKDSNERLERQEEEYRKHTAEHDHEEGQTIGYGQYDNRTDPSSYLAALRNLPPPWRAGAGIRSRRKLINSLHSGGDKEGNTTQDRNSRNEEAVPVLYGLGNLPHQCLLAYYESRRRWIFGGSGLTTRGLAVEGVNNDGTNCHRYNTNHSLMDESLLSVAGVGASTLNKTVVSKMGDFKERLLWSRQPVVGYGCNDSTGSATTTARDGSPVWSADDDAFPLNFFNAKTGEFTDSVQIRVRARLSINFGNPYKDKRGDTFIPENYTNQRPQLLRRVDTVPLSPHTPPGSPPHEALSSNDEEEGEAVFEGTRHPPPSRKQDSPMDKRKADQIAQPSRNAKKQKTTSLTAPHTGEKDVLMREKSSGENNSQSKPPSTPQKGSIKGRFPPNKSSEHSKQKKLPPPLSRPPPPPPSEKSSTLVPKQPKGSLLSSKHRPRPPPQQLKDLSSSKQRPPPPPQQLKPAQQTSKKKSPQPPKAVKIPQTRMHAQHPPPPSNTQSQNIKPKVNVLPVPQTKPRTHHPPPPSDVQGPNIKPKVNVPPVPQTKPRTQHPPPPSNSQSPNIKPKVNMTPVLQTKPRTQHPPPSSDAQSPNIKPKVNLPPGWILVWSKSQRRWYFFDQNTNKSVWEWPPPGSR